ncbi:MAG: sugar ABC transporter substrate-binding protein [Acidimicrobiales bacterium]
MGRVAAACLASGMLIGLAGISLPVAAASASSAVPRAVNATASSSVRTNATDVAAGSCPTATGTLHMAFIYNETDEDPFEEMAMGAAYAATTSPNVDLQEEAPPTNDPPTEVSDFESVIQTAKNGIAYETITPSLWPRPLNQASAAGIPLVAVDTPAPSGTNVPLFVGNSNFNVGYILGKAFVKAVKAKHLNTHGQVVLGNDVPSLIVLINRLKGVEAAIKKGLPHMQIVGPLATEGQAQSQDYASWSAVVSSHPSAVGFVGVGADEGVSLPLIQTRQHRHFLAGSADVPYAALKSIKNGQLFALSSPEHWLKGYVAMEELIHSARTCTPLPSGFWNPGNLLMTKANINQMLIRQKNATTRAAWYQKHDVKAILADVKNPSKILKPMSDAN